MADILSMGPDADVRAMAEALVGYYRSGASKLARKLALEHVSRGDFSRAVLWIRIIGVAEMLERSANYQT
jgi:hypothetical protein